jgi:hypothetical protein
MARGQCSVDADKHNQHDYRQGKEPKYCFVSKSFIKTMFQSE